MRFVNVNRTGSGTLEVKGTCIDLFHKYDFQFSMPQTSKAVVLLLRVFPGFVEQDSSYLWRCALAVLVGAGTVREKNDGGGKKEKQ